MPTHGDSKSTSCFAQPALDDSSWERSGKQDAPCRARTYQVHANEIWNRRSLWSRRSRNILDCMRNRLRMGDYYHSRICTVNNYRLNVEPIIASPLRPVNCGGIRYLRLLLS